MKRLLPVIGLLPLVMAVACGRSEPATPASSMAQPSPTLRAVAAEVTPQPSPTTEVTEAGPQPTLTPPSLPTVVARVNGQDIPLADFQRQLADTQAYLLSQNLIDPNTPEGQEALKALRQQVLEQLIDQALIAQAAERMGITVTDEELEASIEAIKQDLGSEEAFQQSLAVNNLTEEQFRELQRQQLISRELIDTITADVPEEAEQVHARHILVDSREKAEEILKQLEQGADFAELAKKYSLDETSREKGGDLGFFPRGVVLPEFEAIAFSLEPGQRSGVVETSYGFHIIEVLAREVRPIPPDVLEGLRQQKVLDWLEEERAKADIQRFIGE